MSSFLKKNKKGGVVKLVLFVVALILFLAYFGITFTDVLENNFIQFLIGLFNNFWQ